MAWYPKAEIHNIPPGSSDPRIIARIIVIHTMVGTMESSERRFRNGEGIEAHFGVGLDGRVWQWRDTIWQADAQSGGNDYCISIETEDNGEPELPWTVAQEKAIVELMRWLCMTHNIPPMMVATTKDRGVGYHRQFAVWNPLRKSCPGDTRLHQLITEVMPALLAPVGDQDVTDEQIDQIINGINQLHTDWKTAFSSTNHHNFLELAGQQGQIILLLQEIKSLLNTPPREPL